MSDLFQAIDYHGMQLAIGQAHLAARNNEVPVGAVLLDNAGKVLGQGFNRTITDHDPTAHAEIIALRDAAGRVGNYRLPETRLYVTLEPCVMCMGALIHARVAKVVFAATDPKTGACGSVLDVAGIARINHHTRVSGGLMADECSALLSGFFRQRRAQIREQRQAQRVQPCPPACAHGQALDRQGP